MADVECGTCGQANRETAKFCKGCGSGLARNCASCGEGLDVDAAFCDSCGAAVGATPSPFESPPAVAEAVRKTVTALFCDLVGSTAFGEKVDAESAREAMGRYHSMAQSVIEANHGTVAKFIGDGVMALFGVPEVAEDDAERAVHTGLALQAGFGEIRDHISERYGVDVGLRVGINTGEVVIAADDVDVVSDALNTAARLEAACTPGNVLVGESTWRLTRSVVDFAERGTIDAKGKDEPVAAYEVVEAHEAEDELTTPFVGREDELRRLRMVLEDTILERRAHLVTVIGSPGVGKTRLAREMRATVEGGTQAFELRCEREVTATFAPLAELLRSVAGITDSHTVDEMTARIRSVVAGLDDAERVGELLAGFVGAGPMRSTEEMFLGVRRLFEVLGTAKPVVLVVDDIQWAEPLFLDLLEHLAEWVRGVPLLVVCLARPEIREVRPVLTEAGRRVSAVVGLEGLDAAATHELAARLVGADSLPGDLLAKIPESTQGNPLFVRELMRMLVDDGVISNESGSWEMMIDVDAVEVPPTVNSLLASRVERMAPDERRVLELAAVVGSEFPVGAVEAAGEGEHSRAELEATFERLRRKELIEPTGSYWGDEPVFRFHHVLIRDAAYRRLLKGARAELHTRVGEWTERTAATLVGEHEVTIGHHFEQAHLLRRQLDLVGEETEALGARATGLFHLAATRALEREDLAAAGSLARRALGCVDDNAADIAELLLLGCESLLAVGNVGDGAPLVDRLTEVAGDDRRLGAWIACFRVELTVLADPDGLQAAEQKAADAAVVLEEIGDQAGVAKARLQRAGALASLGRIGECETELDLGLAAARSVDDRRRVTAVLGNAPVAALWGPSPVPRAGGRCLDVVRLLRITTGSPAVEATSIRCQAVLEALRGRHDTARTMLQTARATLEELGLTHDLLVTELYAGLVELLADEATTAEPHLRLAYEGLGRMGIGADAGQAAAHLARSLMLQGRLDEAEELSVESHALAGQNPQTAIVSRSAHAEVLSARGQHDDALAIVDEAVRLAAQTDILVDHANAVASQARVRAAAGDLEGADRAAEAANALYEQKGATITVGIDVERSAGYSKQATPESTSSTDPAEGGGSHWGPAVELLIRSHTDMMAGRYEPWVASMTANVVAEERRSLVQLSAEGLDAVKATWPDQPGGRASIPVTITPIAARGDHLALVRVLLQPGESEIGYYLLGRIVNGTQADLFITFDDDDLPAALAELDRLHAETCDPMEALMLSGAAIYGDAIRNKDVDTIQAGYDPDYDAIDHREVGFPVQGREEWGERIRTLFDTAPEIIGIWERLFDHGDDGVTLHMQAWRLQQADGSEQLMRFLSLNVRDVVTGLIVHNEIFDERELEQATARVAELRAEQTPTVRANHAAVIGGWVNPRIRAAVPALDLLVAEPERLTADGAAPHGFGVERRRLLATMGERLALIEVELLDGTWAFSVEEVDDDGLLVDWSIFPGDALRAAADHIDERAMALDEDPTLGLGLRFSTGIRNHDGENLARLMADDFASIDHRQISFDVMDKANSLAFFTTTITNAILLASEILATGPHGLLARTVVYDGVAGSLFEGQVGLDVVSVRDGQITGNESFDAADLDRALAQFHELDAPAEDFAPWNEADRISREMITAQFLREFEVWDVRTHDRMVVHDERPGFRTESLSKAEVVADFWEASEDVWPIIETEIETVAVRGDDLVLHHVVATAISADITAEWVSINRMVDGRSDLAVLMNADDLVAAFDVLDELWAEETGHGRRPDFVYDEAVRHWDIDGIEQLLAAEFVLVDHRELGYGHMDRQPCLDSWQSQKDAGENWILVIEDYVLVTERGNVHRQMTIEGDPDGRFEALHSYGIVVMEDGLLSHNEIFELEDLEVALARFEELTGAPADDPWNEADRVARDAKRQSIAARQFHWVMEGHAISIEEGFRRHGSITAPGHRLDSRLPGLQNAPTADETAENARMLIEQATRLEAELVEVRGPRFIATRARWEYENGFESHRHVAFRFDIEGRIELEVVVETESEVLAVLDELVAAEERTLDLVNSATMLFEAQASEPYDVVAVRQDLTAVLEVGAGDGEEPTYLCVETDVAGALRKVEEKDLEAALDWLAERSAELHQSPIDFRVFVDLGRAVTGADGDAIDAVLAPRFVAHVYSGFGFPTSSRREWIDGLVENTRLGVRTLTAKLLAAAPGLIVSAYRVTAEGDEAFETRALGLFGVGSEGIDRAEHWDGDDVEAALARFDELVAEANSQSIAQRQLTWVMEGHAISFEEGTRRRGSLAAPSHRLESRLPGMQNEPDRAASAEAAATLADQGARVEGELVGTRRARLAASRTTLIYDNGFESHRYMAFRFDVEGRIEREIVVETEAEVLAALDEFEAEEMRSLELVNTATMLFERSGRPFVAVRAVRDDLVAIVEVEPANDGSGAFLCVEASPAGGLTVDGRRSYDEADEWLTTRSVGLRGDPAGFGPLLDYWRATASLDRAALEAALAEDFVAYSFGSTFLPEATRAEMIDYIVAGRDLGVYERVLKVLARGPGLMCIWSQTRVDGDAPLTTDQVGVIAWDDKGVHFHGEYPPEKLDEALAKYDELAAERPVPVANGSRVVAQRGGIRLLVVDTGAVSGFVVEDRIDGGEPAISEFGPDELASAYGLLIERSATQWDASVQETAAAFSEHARLQSARDVEGLALVISDDFAAHDHRELGWPDLDKGTLLELIDNLRDVESVIISPEVIDVRPGGVLGTVIQWTRSGDGWVESFPGRAVGVISDGQSSYYEIFAEDAEAEAQARFDELVPTPASSNRASRAARYDELAGEIESPRLSNRATATSHAEENDALARGDFEAFRAHFHPGVRIVSHRHLGASRESNLDEYVADIRSFVEAGVDFASAKYRILAVRGERLYIEEQRADWADWESGSAGMLTVREVDNDGLIVYVAHYDGEDLTGAHAELDRRFEELAADAGSALPEVRNQASDAWLVHLPAATDADDAEEALRHIREDMVYDVNRRGVGGPGGGLADLADTAASWGTVGLAMTSQAIAVRGERLVLATLAFASDDGGSEIGVVGVGECDPTGRISYVGVWDDVDIRLAINEYFRRGLASDDLSPAARAFGAMGIPMNAHDWDAVAACYVPDLVFVDHSPAGFGSISLEDAVQAWSFLADLVPGFLTLGTVVIRGEEDGGLELVRRFGTDVDGGEVSIDHLMAYLVDDGVIVALESFQPEQLSEALARFDEMLVEHRG